MVRFGTRNLGDGAPCFVTFEAGATHCGVESAKRLVTLAAAAGADAIKFQISRPDRLVADRTMMFSYDILVDRETGATETVQEPLYDILCRRALSFEQWREVKRHADESNLAFFATASFDDQVDLLVELDCHSIKIASADINHKSLIRRVAATGVCVQLDTGNATLGEIEAAVDLIREQGNENIIVHHCPSGYPARLESINLRMIPTLKRMFDFPIGFSDHTPGWEMDVAAVALGANLVEKTITEDRMTRSIEHLFSLEPHEMTAFVKRIRDLQTAMGQPRKVLHPEEKARRQRIRRSVYVMEPAQAGTRVRDLKVEFQRPGDGISPDLFEQFLDARLGCDVEGGHHLTLPELVWA